MIVKTDNYSIDEIARVVQLRANVEGLKLSGGVLEKLAAEGEKSSLRYVFQPYSCVVLTQFQICTSTFDAGVHTRHDGWKNRDCRRRHSGDERTFLGRENVCCYDWRLGVVEQLRWGVPYHMFVIYYLR